MKKKILITALIAGMTIATAGCGGTEITGNSEISSETVTATETSEIQTITTAPVQTEEKTSESETTVAESVQTETEYFSEETKEIISETVQTEVETSGTEEIISEPVQTETETTEIPDISLHTYEKVSTSEDIQTATQILLKNLDTIDRMGGCAVQSDDENTEEYNGRDFRKVLDTNYSSKADIENFVSAYMTGEARDYFSFLTSGEKSVFEEINGELYVADEGRGCGFNWTNDTEIKDSSESGFTVIADYEDYGAVSSAEVNIVNDNGFWKIESYNRYYENN